ncbi:MAG: Gfo/Idh/MocA family protein [Acidimicrobiales bacterium]
MRWALVGTTGWADHTFAGAITSGGGTLVGAAGSTLERSKAFAKRHGLDTAYASLDDLLADDALDVVWVASPSDLHAEHAVAVLRAGKHLLVEKPLARTRGECVPLVTAAAAAAATGRVAVVGFQHRCHPAHLQLRGLVAGGGLGRIVSVRLRRFVDYGTAPQTWRLSPERSGGWAVNDLGTHLIDLVHYVVGPTVFAGAHLGNPAFGEATDDLAVVVLRLDGGGAGVVEVATGVEDGPLVFEVVGLEGRATLVDSWGGTARLETGDGTSAAFEVCDVHRAQVVEVERLARDTAAGGRPDGPLASIADGMAVTALVAQAVAVSS